MLTQQFKSASRVRLLRSRPAASLLEAFAQYLGQSGYSNVTARRHLRAAEHFTYWADHEGIQVESFNHTVLGRFAEHLNGCQCENFSRRAKALALTKIDPRPLTEIDPPASLG